MLINSTNYSINIYIKNNRLIIDEVNLVVIRLGSVVYKLYAKKIDKEEIKKIKKL